MRYAQIRNGVVENVVEAPVGADKTWTDGTLIPSVTASPGWMYLNGSFIPPMNPPPQEIALWQARAILKQYNALDGANALVEQSGNDALKAFWEYGNTIHRNSGILASLAAALGMNDAQLDELFRKAADLSL